MPSVDVDAIAYRLIDLARYGKNCPPSWRLGRIRTPVVGPDGQRVGYILPGEGLQLNVDLKQLGITKKDPRLKNIFQYSQGRRFADHVADLLLDKRGALTTYDSILTARAGGKHWDSTVMKQSITTTASDWYEAFRIAGTPAAGTYNSTTAPTQTAMGKNTLGAWNVGTPNTTGAELQYLLTFGWSSTSLLNIGVLVDCHVQSGAHRLTVTSAETVASPVTITRQYYSPLGAGCYLIAVTTTGASATATNLTVTYVDQDNNAGQTVVIAGPATATIASQLWPDSSSSVGGGPYLALASGDYGVRSFSQTQSGTALAAGVLALLIVTPLLVMPGIAASAYVERDSTIQIDGLKELAQVSNVAGCLSLLMMTNTTTSGVIMSFLRQVWG